MRDVPDYGIIRWLGRSSSACVVIPVINEGDRIGLLLDRMRLQDVSQIADIIIVDGGSTDGSLSQARLDDANVIGLLVKQSRGKLSAQLRCAYDFVLAQGYTEIVTIDGNNKDDPDPIPDFIAKIKEGVDFVQASRFIPGGIDENTPAKRRFAVQYIHAPALSIASGFHWTDTTQGFRAYSRRLLVDERIGIFRHEFSTYELLAYLNYRAPRLGYRCIEMPTARRYPANEAVPTKIDFRGEIGLLWTLARTCFGAFNPSDRAFDESSGYRSKEWKSAGFTAGSYISAVLLVILTCLVVLMTTFQVPFSEPLVDLFQEGELIAPRLYFENWNTLPLLIHGQMDYIPSQLAALGCSEGKVIACTRLVNASLNAIVALLFIACTVSLAQRGRRGWVYALFIALILLVMVNGPRSSAIYQNQGAPALRDLGLFLILAFIVLGEKSAGRMRNVSMFCATLIAGISVFLSYNRGITGVIAVALMIGTAAVAWRNRKIALIGVAGLALGFLIHLYFSYAMTVQHIENIIYWSGHSEIWAFRPSLTLFLLGITFYLPIMILLFLAILGISIRWVACNNRNDAPLVVFLITVIAIIVQQSINRYDAFHLSFAIPWVFILSVKLANWLPRGNRGLDSRDLLVVSSLFGLVFLDMASPGSLLTRIGWSTLDNLRLTAKALPNDKMLISRDLLEAVKYIKKGGDRCAYAANNAAAIYHLAELPPCSSVMVPVYATGLMEGEVIKDLEREHPSMIVWDSSDWFARVDSRGLEQRTPNLSKWIKANYRYTVKFGAITFRTRIAGQ